MIAGYGAVYYRSDDPGTEYDMGDVVERISPGAFDDSLGGDRDIVSLVNHDESRLLGRVSAGTLRVSTNRRGLRYEIPYDEHDDDHRQVKRKLEKRDITGSSFAFRIEDEDWGVEDDGRQVRTINRVKLVELGPVTFPAYKSASSYLRQEDLEEIRAARPVVLGSGTLHLDQLVERLDDKTLEQVEKRLGERLFQQLTKRLDQLELQVRMYRLGR